MQYDRGVNKVKGGYKVMKKLRKSIGVVLSAIMVATAFTGCGKGAVSSVTDGDKKVVLTYALADPQDYAYWDEKSTEFTKEHPNITVDIECFGGTDEMMKNLKIRQSANELPDVIQLKPDFINDFKSFLLEWDENDPMVKNNTFAGKFKQDDKIYGLPLRSFSEFVYYKKSIFKELGLTIPETWEDFIATAEKIKEESDYIPIAMGGKDVWPVYPFNEFMPHLVGNDEKILTNITKADEPFSAGSGFYEAYKMIDEIYRTNVMGTDPLGMGCDQCQQLFEANKAAMILLGQWYLPNYLERVGNADDLGFFALPVVHKGETNRLMTMADNFLTINKNSENVEAAKLFIEWSFSKEIYSGYLTATLNNSTVAGIDNDNPLFKEFRDNNKADLFLYYPGDDNYSKLVNQTKFDTKNIGQKMLAGESFEDILAEMNGAWKAARAELGIQ